MTTASQNVFAKIIAAEGAAAATPAAGTAVQYVKTDGRWYSKDDAGLEVGPFGSASHSYIGYNTVGSSFEALVPNTQLMKKVTVASAGVLLSVGFHLKVPTTTDIVWMTAFVLDDNAGAPSLLRAQSTTHQLGFKNGNAARWYHVPLGIYLTAADYWIGSVVISNANNSMQIAYDTGGSDPTFVVGAFALDGNYTATTNSTKSYSIRGDFIG